jgi:DNA-binding MarR family transcriptional regulator
LYITTNMSKHNDNIKAVFQILQEIGKVMRIFQSEAVLCNGVTFAQFCILDHANARGGSVGLIELHGLLSVEKSTTTRLVGPLIKRKLVTKETSEHDSRMIELSLTAKGKEVHSIVWECISGLIEGVMKCIPNDQQNKVLDAIGIFIQSIHHCCCGSPRRDCG